MTIAWLLAAIAAMIGASGLFAALESAIVTISRGEQEELAAGRSAGTARAVLAAPAAHANALAFARVLLESMSAVLATMLLLDVFPARWQAFAAAVGVMLVVSFLVTGTSPRSVGRAHPRGLLGALGWIARTVRFVLGPLADLLVAIGDRVTPGRPRRADAVTSEEQLLDLVDEAADLDVLEDEERELIHSVFGFSDRIVREVMIARTDMIAVEADETAAAALDRMLEHGISRAPLVGRDRDDVRGVLYLKDLVRRELRGRSGGQAPLERLARPAAFVPESLATSALLRQMQASSNHFAVVVDEYGGVAGIATMEDLIEQLVGEISDEYDRDADEAEELAPGVLRVSSRMSAAELGERFGTELDDEDVDSVGGLMAKLLGKVPGRGDVAFVDGIELRADRIGRRGRVDTVVARSIGGDGPRGGEPEDAREREDA
ncbi:MAG: hemolysin family protein [Pseudoclavibacter sp.]|nr:hemolysin family protein [Pseudoclavibacter sp.]